MDLRWLRGAWSSHLEFQYGGLWVRTDFFTRPPRISPAGLEEVWKSQEGRHPPFLGLKELADLKKTNREKDYAVIGELARKLTSPKDQLLYSRSARDLLEMKKLHPREWQKATAAREALKAADSGLEELEDSLDKERRRMMKENEIRLDKHEKASTAWASLWPGLNQTNSHLPLYEAHANIIAAAEGVLPYEP